MESERSLKIEERSTGDKSIEGRYHRFNKLLGKGAYKTVWKAFDTKDQVDVAWNSIDLSSMTESEKEKVFLECEMLQRLNHPNILKIREQWRNIQSQELCFVTDIIQNGSLRSYFKERKINFKSIKQICYQILLALNYLHTNNVIHRDLKCDNIFIDSNNSKVVLGDLGLSVNFNGQSRMSIVGTPHWMAPELYNEKYNELVDIWSFGMCVLELATNTIPYKECKNTIAVYNKVMVEKQKPDILYTVRDPYIKSFINICLDFNYKLRPSANELISHPFLLPRYPRDYKLLCDKKKKRKKNKKHKFKNDVHVQKVVSKRNFITTIKLQIYRANDKPMAVTFDFNVMVDKPHDVAEEMICELRLPQIYKLKVENAINKAIQADNAHKTQIVGQSLILKCPPKQPKQPIMQTIPSVSPTPPKAKPKQPIQSKHATAPKAKPKPKQPIQIQLAPNSLPRSEGNNDLKNELVLKGLSWYASGEIAQEIDEKSQEQIVKKRDELIKEYNDFIVTKQELLKLRIESITEKELRQQEITKIKVKIDKKKSEMEQQYENFINDYKDIAQYTLNTKKVNIVQNFMFENDKIFISVMQSNLSRDDKYKFKNNLKDYRQQIVEKYLTYYSNLIKQYSQ